MRMRDTFLKPMHPEGWKFVPVFAGVTLVLFWLWQPLGWIGLGLTVWCYYFFRDPKRAVPVNKGLLVSPADGVVSLIGPAVPPEELGLGPAPLMRVSVFMSVFNCHVNRAPIAGRVTAVAYRPGKFLNASLDKASTDNERNALAIEMEDGRRIAVVQIAGLVARRILNYAEIGNRYNAGERYGFIRFGSRVDFYLPLNAKVKVSIGDKVYASSTVIAELDQAA